MKTSPQGSALMGIVVIIIVLVSAGMYFYKSARQQVLEHRAALSQTEKASSLESVQ